MSGTVEETGPLDVETCSCEFPDPQSPNPKSALSAVWVFITASSGGGEICASPKSPNSSSTSPVSISPILVATSNSDAVTFVSSKSPNLFPSFSPSFVSATSIAAASERSSGACASPKSPKSSSVLSVAVSLALAAASTTDGAKTWASPKSPKASSSIFVSFPAYISEEAGTSAAPKSPKSSSLSCFTVSTDSKAVSNWGDAWAWASPKPPKSSSVLSVAVSLALAAASTTDGAKTWASPKSPKASSSIFVSFPAYISEEAGTSAAPKSPKSSSLSSSTVSIDSKAVSNWEDAWAWASPKSPKSSSSISVTGNEGTLASPKSPKSSSFSAGTCNSLAILLSLSTASVVTATISSFADSCGAEPSKPPKLLSSKLDSEGSMSFSPLSGWTGTLSKSPKPSVSKSCFVWSTLEETSSVFVSTSCGDIKGGNGRFSISGREPKGSDGEGLGKLNEGLSSCSISADFSLPSSPPIASTFSWNNSSCVVSTTPPKLPKLSSTWASLSTFRSAWSDSELLPASSKVPKLSSARSTISSGAPSNVPKLSSTSASTWISVIELDGATTFSSIVDAPNAPKLSPSSLSNFLLSLIFSTGVKSLKGGNDTSSISPNASNADIPKGDFVSLSLRLSSLVGATAISSSSCDFFSSVLGTPLESIAGEGSNCLLSSISENVLWACVGVVESPNVPKSSSAAKSFDSNSEVSAATASTFDTIFWSPFPISGWDDWYPLGKSVSIGTLPKSPNSSSSLSASGASFDFFSSTKGDCKGGSGRLSTSGKESNGSDSDAGGMSE